MPAKSCPQCGPGSRLETDLTAGNVLCLSCGTIVEEGILVSEVGFSEGAGGRVHVAGAFVSHGATGVSGFRGQGSGGSENVKAQGQQRIHRVAQEMDLGFGIEQGALRTYSLAVDQRFNRGRRTDYLIASCLYLQCRMMKDHHMLIDFAERLRVNVYELASTYLKLRTTLHIDKLMPEVDPAIYNLHFSKRLDFGPQTNLVAVDASRLVRRFKADWMTQGRRPAGVCGACIIIAGRMNNFLRTPEEVGQVVKCSPYTIRKRLREFAMSNMANRTVKEWRNLKDWELDQGEEEVPPIVKEQREQARKKALAEKDQAEAEALDNDEEGENDEEEQEEEEEEEEEEDEPESSRRPKKRRKEDVVDPNQGLKDLFAEFSPIAEDIDIPDEEEEDDMEPMAPTEYASELVTAGENPEEALADQKKRKAAFQRQNRKLLGADQSELIEAEIDEEEAHHDEEGEESNHGDEPQDEEMDDNIEGEDQEDHDGKDDDGDEEEHDELQPTPLHSINSGKPPASRVKPNKNKDTFSQWDDEEAILTHFTERYFADEAALFGLNTDQVKKRVKQWMKRDPKEMLKEIISIDQAYRHREIMSRMPPEEEFDDIDDEELEAYYLLDEEDRELRARIWLSQNGKWLEESKKRAEEKAAIAKEKGHDLKPRQKRKHRAVAGPGRQQYNSATEAIASFAAEKKFSTRINYDALRQLGLSGGDGEEGEDGLQVMGDDDDKEEDGGKYDDDKDDDGNDPRAVLRGLAGLGAIDGNESDSYSW